MKTYTPFYKQIDIKPSRYEGRNGVMNLTGVSVASVNIGTGIRLNPVNSKGVADNTWLDIPKEDIPALIALLQESIGQTGPQKPSFTVREMEFGNLLGTIGTVQGETNDELEEAIIRLVEQNIVCDKDSVEIVNEARSTDRPFIAKVRWEVGGEGYRTDYELVPVTDNN